MVSKNVFIENLELVRKYKDIPGDIVECGVWRGGMIAGIAEIFGKARDYHLFDSFEGLPKVKEIDGQAASDWQNNTLSPSYYNNCKAEIEFANTALKKTKAVNIVFHKGWFSQTLPEYHPKNGIAVLRMDGDWYDSTMEILMNLFQYVNKGGLIIIDDYYQWDGCSKAVHDYFSSIKASAKIYQLNNTVAYIKK